MYIGFNGPTNELKLETPSATRFDQFTNISKLVHNTTEIDAPYELVHEIVCDVAGYPTWNPGAGRVTGKATVGETIRFVMKPLPMPIPLDIMINQLDEEMGVLMWGKESPHYRGYQFQISRPIGPERTFFEHTELYGGAIPTAMPNLRFQSKRFSTSDAALKAHAERTHRDRQQARTPSNS